MIRGMYRSKGVRPASHFTIECSFTSSWFATSICRRPRSSRRFFRCSPIVLGAAGSKRVLRDFNRIGPNGNKATRPCRCGYLDDASRACSRAPRCAEEYQSKISGPLFDRIDLHVEAPAVNPADLSLPPPAEGSQQVAARVAAARAKQSARYARIEGERPIRTNAEADGRLLEDVAAPEADGRKLLTDAAEKLKLSARGYHRVLRVARTIADLDASAGVRRIHIAEALSYRRIQPGR